MQAEVDDVQHKLGASEGKLAELQAVIKAHHHEQDAINKNELHYFQTLVSQQDKLLELIDQRNAFYRKGIAQLTMHTENAYHSLSQSAQVLNQALGINLPVKEKTEVRVKDIGHYAELLLTEFASSLQALQHERHLQ